MLDPRRAVTYPIRSPRWWWPVLIGSALAAIPQVGSIVSQAFILSVTARVANGEGDELPSWRSLEALVLDALRLTGLYVAIGVGFAVTLLIVIILGAIPLFTLAIFIDALDVVRHRGLRMPLLWIVLLAAVVTIAPMAQVLTARLAVTRSLRASLDLGATWAMPRAKPGPWIFSVIAPLAITAPFTWGSRLTRVDLPGSSGAWTLLSSGPITFWSLAMGAHLIGQAHRSSADVLPRRRAHVRGSSAEDQDGEPRPDHTVVSHPVLYDSFPVRRRPPAGRRPPS